MSCSISIYMEACTRYSAVYCIVCFCPIQVLIGRALTDVTVSRMALVFQSNGWSDNRYLCADSALIRTYDRAIDNEFINNLISNMAV